METIKFLQKEYTVLERLRSNKIIISDGKKRFVIVPFNHIEDMNKYLSNKKILKKMKVEMARVLKIDKAALLVLEEFIVGEPLPSILALARLTDADYMELFRIYRNNRFANIVLNYAPANFVKRGLYFYYVNDEVYNLDSRIAFEKGNEILLWLNTTQQKKYIEKCGYKYFDRQLITNDGEVNKKIALLCTAFW